MEAMEKRKANSVRTPALSAEGIGLGRNKTMTPATEARIRLFKRPAFNTKILA
jgi:hypothetical protein